MEIVAKIEAALEPLIEQHGMELVDVQWATESGRKILRVFIDKPGGILLSDCETMSAVIGQRLDDDTVVASQYVLEVSSPGMERVLKKEKDFARFVGTRARIVTDAPINGQRNFCGSLQAAAHGTVTINDLTNGMKEIPLKAILRARLDPEF